MNCSRTIAPALMTGLLLLAAAPDRSWSMGFTLGPSFSTGGSLSIQGTFTSQRAEYRTQGTCMGTGRLGAKRPFFIVVGGHV